MYPTKNQWHLASGLTDNFTVGSNSGDIPAPFVYLNEDDTEPNTTITVGNLSITIPNKTYKLKWDSKTGIVSGTDNTKDESTRKPVLYTGESIGGIPVGETAVTP